MHTPAELAFSRRLKRLRLTDDEGRTSEIDYRLLRANSPSAETRGHGASKKPSQPETVPDDIDVTAAEPVGHYAVRLTFNDGHRTGLYTWDLLTKLAAMSDAHAAHDPAPE